MNKKEILTVVEVVSNEKEVPKEVIFQALEAALASAGRKAVGGEADVRVVIDRRTGDTTTYRRWQVVEDDQGEDYHPDRYLLLDEARQNHPNIQLGEYIEDTMPSAVSGRIAAQTAKQVIVQKVREAERTKVVDTYRHKVGQLVTGVVKRIERGNVLVDLGDNAEGVVFKEEMISRESVRTNDRIRGFLFDVRPEPRGPQLFISRTRPEFLIELFKLEVPEVGEGVVEIVAAARDPGVRAKIAVRTKDPRLDPIGACVGMRGSRVTAVSNELNGERVDIILWNENPAQYVINAMSPADVVSIVVDEETHSMIVAVEESNLSQAIGRGGQNVRLASELTGWELNVMNETEAAERSEVEARELMQTFQDSMGVGEDVAMILVQEGFSSLDEIAYVPIEELLSIQEFDEDIVNELRKRAQDVLLTLALKEEEAITGEDLAGMEGMDPETLGRLASMGVHSMDELAELSVDEVMEIEGMDEERAARLIMTARAPWFAEEEN